MEAINKKDIKVIKGMIGDREREICIQEHQKCNDSGVRKAQEEDTKLKTLYKILETFKNLEKDAEK